MHGPQLVAGLPHAPRHAGGRSVVARQGRDYEHQREGARTPSPRARPARVVISLLVNDGIMDSPSV
eukprot:6184819-Prymnesium_polylepis.2